MDILKIVLTIIYVIDCIGLTVIVLMQEGKDAGLGAIAGAAETYWGQNRGRSMEGGLEKATKVMAVIFFVLSISVESCEKYCNHVRPLLGSRGLFSSRNTRDVNL